MHDAFGVERSEISKGLPSALRNPNVKGAYAGFRRAAHEEGRYAAKMLRRGQGRVKDIEVKQGQLDRKMSRDSLSRRAKKSDIEKLHEVNKAWNSILKPNMGVGPTMTPKQMKQARKAAQQVNAIKPKKAQKIMNAAAAEPQGTQVAPGVTAYAPQPPKAPKPAKQKKQKSFFERNRTGLMWGGGGAGAGLLGGYAMSGSNRG